MPDNLFPVRVQQPEKFDPSKKTDIVVWLYKVNLWFETAQIPEEIKIVQAASLLDGNAFIWWMMLTRNNQQPTTWR